MNVGIFIADSNGAFPVPASKGGAVSTLVEHIVESNSSNNKVDLEVISYYDKDAFELSKKYKNVNFTWIRIPFIVKKLDSLLYNFIKICFKKKKSASYRSLFSLLYYIIKGSKKLKKTRYDKVVLENNIPLAWIIKLSKYNGEYFYHFHNVPRINAKCKDVFERCTAFLCVSNYVAEQILSVDNPIGPVKKEQIRILYNCVDTDLFSNKSVSYDKIELKKRFNIPIENKVVIFVGRLSQEKGIDILLKAVKQLDNEKITVLIVGSHIQGSNNVSDPYEIYLQELSNEMNEKIRFTGYIAQNEVPGLYNSADVAVLPSMWDEPAGLTMIEAMACGVPVITTNSGGIPEYAGGKSIVLERDELLVDNLANAIKGVLFDGMDYDVAGAQERVRKEFSLNEYIDRLTDVIK